MEEKEMLAVARALGNPERLRVIGALTQAPATVTQVSESLGISVRDALNHLTYLTHIGTVQKNDELYRLDQAKVDALARAQLAGPRGFEPDPALDEKTRKVLKAYLNQDGSIRQMPLQPAKLQVILEYLLQFFQPGTIYTEKEVNQIIRRFHEDTAGLRRDLIDRGMLKRKSDGSQYWRPATGETYG